MNVTDSLPPHSENAERAVIGSILAADLDGPDGPGQALSTAMIRLQSPEAFYDLRNRIVIQAMLGLHVEGKPINVVLLQERLKDTGNLDSVGGASFISSLPDHAAPGLLDRFVDIVAQKALARDALQMTAGWQNAIRPAGQISEGRIEEMLRQLNALQAKAVPALDRAPKSIRKPTDVGDEVFKLWFDQKSQVPGWDLPFPFVWKIRTHEMSVFTGDNGAGKSSFLSQLVLNLAEQGVKSCIASMEMPIARTVWIMTRQMLGTNTLEHTKQNEQRLTAAIFWLSQWVDIYDFLGITTWQGLLDVFRYERRERAMGFFVVDSVMRIGIEDDDYSQQGIAAATFAKFAVTTGAHLVLVVHQNKSTEGSQKNRVRGTKQWTDNADNVIGIMRHEKKGEKIAEIEAGIERTSVRMARGKLSIKQVEEAAKEVKSEQEKKTKLEEDWDSKFFLQKQRFPGTPQNGSRFLGFDKTSLQFYAEGAQPRHYGAIPTSPELPSSNEMNL